MNNSKPELRPRRTSLTSEERCRKAFEQWYPKRHQGEDGLYYDDGGIGLEHVAWNSWQAAWKYLESRVTEFIEA